MKQGIIGFLLAIILIGCERKSYTKRGDMFGYYTNSCITSHFEKQVRFISNGKSVFPITVNVEVCDSSVNVFKGEKIYYK